MTRLAIFASGRGSNALKIIEHFQIEPTVEVALIVANTAKAGVLQIAEQHHIPTFVVNRATFYEKKILLDKLRALQIDFITLAGFLWLIPTYIIEAYPNRLLNIHPALLPKYGGKGMYGMNVHRAVQLAQETKSGITIHYVNEHYDEGNMVFQATCDLALTDDATAIARKVQLLEHQHFPSVIEATIAAL
ncbi:MAG: phosphoribosylglycinamide formyltransferase [Bacteroidota bacterium]